jgi:hypothetical protein
VSGLWPKSRLAEQGGGGERERTSDARALTSDDERRGEVGGPQAPRGAEWAIYA